MDNKFHVFIFCAFSESFDFSNSNGPLKIFIFDVAELVGREQQVALLFHREPVVLDD
jgi:hypothetical protein